jgi:hypothetical protein
MNQQNLSISYIISKKVLKLYLIELFGAGEAKEDGSIKK